MSGGMGSHLTPYAAAYAQNVASAWNSYSVATFQGLQRAGVTYGESVGFTLDGSLEHDAHMWSGPFKKRSDL